MRTSSQLLLIRLFQQTTSARPARQPTTATRIWRHVLPDLTYEYTTTSVRYTQGRARFFNSMIDWQIGRHYFLMGGWLNYRGISQNYDQISISLGYRFGR